MTNFMYVNGIALPPPATVDFTLNSLDLYGERNNMGDLNRKLAPHSKKMTYSLAWEHDENFDLIYNTLKDLPEFATFKIPQPGTSSISNFEGYIGAITCGVFAAKRINNSVRCLWGGLKVKVIER